VHPEISEDHVASLDSTGGRPGSRACREKPIVIQMLAQKVFGGGVKRPAEPRGPMR